MLAKATLLVTPPLIRNLSSKVIKIASASFTNGPRNGKDRSETCGSIST